MRKRFTISALTGLIFGFTGATAISQTTEDHMNDKLKGREAYLDKIDNLDEMQSYVTLHDGTEPPFKNKYWDHKEEGIYVDVITGKALFSSTDKFDSGTGWPSFTKPIEDHEVTEKEDRKLGMTRTEVRSSTGDAHLGHVFPDGPKEKGGQRYCINSAALDFVPKAEMKERGYGQYLVLFEKEDQ